MEKSFDFGPMLNNHEKKHKSKPSRFASVAGGTKKRVEAFTKHRKSSRLTIFDSIRNLHQTSRGNRPVPISERRHKLEHQRQQLDKWKDKKEKNKKELAAMKKKPFVVGVPHNPLKFVPPPPLPKPVPSTSGHVTRSQSAKNKNETKETKQPQIQSFAPKNAAFHTPHIKNKTKMPNLAPLNTRKDKKFTAITFDPVSHNKAQTEVKQTRSKTLNKMAVESRITRSATVDMKTKVQNTKPIQKAPLIYFQSPSSSENEDPSQIQTSSSSDDDITVQMFGSYSNCLKFDSSSTEPAKSSSSYSELETVEVKKKKFDKPKTRKSISTFSTPASKSKTPQNSTTSRRPHLTQQNDETIITPRNLFPKSDYSTEEKLRSPKTPVNSWGDKISPRVTLSRGKSNARKEMKNKLNKGLLDEDTSNIEIDHFRKQLSSEIKRITKMCETWDKINKQVALPENIQEQMLGGVGQARLLISHKMQQFATLVERCARPEPGSALVTVADLQGFWDMVFMQVENVDMRFKSLKQLKARNWIEDAPAPVPKPRPTAKLPKVIKPKATGAPSRLKEMIAAARKRKNQDLAPSAEVKVFEADFFTVRSQFRSPTTPNSRQNLLKAVLPSVTKKSSTSKKSASFAMLRASALGKNMECDRVMPLPQTPAPQFKLNSTPGLSILKQTQDSTASKICNKVVKVVLFNQSFTDINDNTSTGNTQLDTNTENQPITSLTEIEMNSMKNNKENSRKKPTLTRQDAVSLEHSPVMTISRHTSIQTAQTEEKNKVVKVMLFNLSFTDINDYTSTGNTQLDTNTENQPITSVTDIEINSTKNNKENSRRAPMLTRQNAVCLEHSPVIMRSRHNSIQTAQTEEKNKVVKVKLFNQSFTKINDSISIGNTQLDTNTENQPITSITEIEMNSTKNNKENSRKKPTLTRQDAVSLEHSPVMTRSRHTSIQTAQTEEKNKVVKVVLFNQSFADINDYTSTGKTQLETNIENQPITVVTDIEMNSMKNNKENSRRTPMLTRQDAVCLEHSPVMMRSRHNSIQTAQTEEKNKVVKVKLFNQSFTKNNDSISIGNTQLDTNTENQPITSITEIEMNSTKNNKGNLH